MADITKCNGNECPKIESCWRYKAPSSEWQSWMDSGHCIEKKLYLYWDLDNNKTSVDLKKNFD